MMHSQKPFSCCVGTNLRLKECLIVLTPIHFMTCIIINSVSKILMAIQWKYIGPNHCFSNTCCSTQIKGFHGDYLFGTIPMKTVLEIAAHFLFFGNVFNIIGSTHTFPFTSNQWKINKTMHGWAPQHIRKITSCLFFFHLSETTL